MPTLSPPEQCIVVVEDHPLTRMGIASALRSADFLVVDVENATHGLTAVRTHHPSAVIVDLDLPDHPGLWLIQKVAEETPDTAILVVSASIDERHIAECLDAGARGYVSKNVSSTELVAKVTRLLSGDEVYDDIVATRLIRSLRTPADPTRPRLSPREVEVLKLLAEGSDAAAIAATLFLSVHTVRDVLRSVYRKLGVHDKASAVAAGFRHGILS